MDTRETRSFTVEDLDLMRQWFLAIYDVNPVFLEYKDYELGIRLIKACGDRVSNKMIEDFRKSKLFRNR